MEAVLRIYGVLVFFGHGFKGQAGGSGPGFGGGGRGPVRFRPDAQIDEADQDVHVDESVSLHSQCIAGHATDRCWPRAVGRTLAGSSRLTDATVRSLQERAGVEMGAIGP